MRLFEEELTYEIRGCFFDVQNEVGYGFSEEPYHQALKLAFAQQGISARSKHTVKVLYHNHPVHELRPDFIVGEKVVLELKAAREGFVQDNFVQLFSYLKATRLRLGFLVNFGRERVQDQRIIFDDKPVEIEEDWTAVKDRITGDEMDVMNATRDAILKVAAEHGLGYGESLYRKLFTAAMSIDCALCVFAQPLVQPLFHDKVLDVCAADCLVAAERIVVLIVSLKDGLESFDVKRCKSFIRNLGLKYGVVANFGKDRLQVHGVSV